MISNPSERAGVTCALTLHGVTLPGFSTSYTMGKSGWVIATTAGTDPFQAGYASLQCTAIVEAQLLYSFFAPNGTKLSEATVFSSPQGSTTLVIADERDGAQLGLAIANDSDQTVTYSISSGNAVGPPMTLGPRTSTAKFVHDFVPHMAPNAVSAIVVSSTSDRSSVIGLRYTGNIFTTIPEIGLIPQGVTASSYHVFPQFADGKFSDGTYYRTTRMYLNPSATASTSCVTRLRGLTTNGTSSFTGNLPAGSFTISITNGTQAFQSGYATVECTSSIEAQALYSLYGPSGEKLSEATVFSSPSAKTVQILADSRGGAQVGLAIANDSDQTNTYTITVRDVTGNVVGSTTQQLGPRTSIAKFVNQLVPLPPNHYGPVMVTSSPRFRKRSDPSEIEGVLFLF
jgi:hypothetical protein